MEAVDFKQSIGEELQSKLYEVILQISKVTTNRSQKTQMKTYRNIEIVNPRQSIKRSVTLQREPEIKPFIPYSFKDSSSSSKKSAPQTNEKPVFEESKEKKLFEEDHKSDSDDVEDFARKKPTGLLKKDDAVAQNMFRGVGKLLMPPKKF